MKTKTCSASATTSTGLATAPQAPVVPPKPDAFIGIDFHKRYNVCHVLDPVGCDLVKGRINHHTEQKVCDWHSRLSVLLAGATEFAFWRGLSQ